MAKGVKSEKELKQAYEEWHRSRLTIGTTISKDDRNYYARIIDILRPYPGKSILDVGCGTGKFLALATEIGLKAYGIDISEVAIELARKKATDAEILCGMAEQLPWEDNLFDYVVCLGSLQHCYRQEKVTSEMARVLKPDGLGCILVPNSYFIGFVLMAWLRSLPPDLAGEYFSERFGTCLEWRSLLESQFEILRIFKFNPWLTTPKFTRIAVLLYNTLLRPLLPLNLSDSFVFLVRKRLGE